MSTFLLMLVHLLADMGVPMMRQMEQHLDAPPAAVTVQRAGPAAHHGPSQARSAPTSEWEKRPRQFDNTQEISNGF